MAKYVDHIHVAFLTIAIIIMAAYALDLRAVLAKKEITTACTTEGQFTVSGRTYRCGVIDEETIQQSKARKFEQCRAWLHNSERGE